MLSSGVIGALGLFIVGMVYLRTRLQYPQRPRGLTPLTRAGASYFAALLLTLVAGWFLAPFLARFFLSTTPLSPTLGRVVWFLGAYYLFIPVHQVLRAQGVEVFKPALDSVHDERSGGARWATGPREIK